MLVSHCNHAWLDLGKTTMTAQKSGKAQVFWSITTKLKQEPQLKFKGSRAQERVSCENSKNFREWPCKTMKVLLFEFSATFTVHVTFELCGASPAELGTVEEPKKQNTREQIPCKPKLLSLRVLYGDISLFQIRPWCKTIVIFQIKLYFESHWLGAGGMWPLSRLRWQKSLMNQWKVWTTRPLTHSFNGTTKSNPHNCASCHAVCA